MAELSLEEALAAGRLVLFDTNVLISAYDFGDADHVRQVELFRRVPPGSRFTTELVMWELLRYVSAEERRRRAQWRRLQRVQIRGKPPAGYVETTLHLARIPPSIGNPDPVDGSLCAHAVATRESPTGRFVIATADRADFTWHADVDVILDFFAPTPP